MYSCAFFTLNKIKPIPTIAPIKNAIIEIIKILENPKYSPNAAINFTSPSPIASFY